MATTVKRVKVASGAYARIADRRRDHLHQLTTRLVRDNQTIVIEDLAVRNMVKNHTLARAISDAAWRQFRSMLEYKADWHGRRLVVVDRWFPSSKLCSTCGALAERMPLREPPVYDCLPAAHRVSGVVFQRTPGGVVFRRTPGGVVFRRTPGGPSAVSGQSTTGSVGRPSLGARTAVLERTPPAARLVRVRNRDRSA